VSDSRKQRIDDLCALDRKLQMLLSMQWQHHRLVGGPPLVLSDVEFRTFSQNGEDGVLLYIFSAIGMTNRRVVEICAGNGLECNAANLIINHGWKGLLFDGNGANVEHARQLYATLADTFIRPPIVVHAWVTAENVNDLIRAHGFSGEIDFLSIDIDGVDYWLWKAIECVQPRVVTVEYNAFWGPHRAVTVPYNPEFRLDFSRVPYYCGASLAAFVKLARDRGYRLVGAPRSQINAFFVRNDLGTDVLQEVDAATCLDHWVEHDWKGQRWVDV
jgi:hypothetical protein